MSKKKIKRKAESWLKSLEMYPERKILIVEGNDDKMFIEYLSEPYNSKVLILDVNSIDVSESVNNGNKGRLLYIAEIVKNKSDRFKVFIDKDYSTFEGTIYPISVITTDFRDVEAYLYEIDFLNKFIKIGIKTNKLDPIKLLEGIENLAFFGFIRIASILNKLNLSVNKTNEKLSKYIKIKQDLSIEILKDKYINSLIQNSNYSINYEKLSKLIENVIEKYSNESFKNIVQGKDAITFIKYLVSKLNFKKDNIENVFWMSFEKTKINNYNNLKKVIEFVK